MRRGANIERSLCFKCKAKPEFAYRNGLKCCKECFKYQIVETKFRGSIRKDLDVVGKGDNREILLLLSGGINSTCLAFMAGESLMDHTFSKR